MNCSWKQKSDCKDSSLQSSQTNDMRYPKARTGICVIMAFVLSALMLLQPTSAYAQSGPICYGVTDGLGNASGVDTLVSLDVLSGNATTIGQTGTFNIEAIAFSPDGQTLYAANQGELGVLDLATGAYASIGAFGSGTGSDGTQTMEDVDSLTYDIATDTLFGVSRRANEPTDLLFKIDPATGAIIPDGFGAGVDYVEVPVSSVGDDDVDDIAADPYTGILYGVVYRRLGLCTRWRSCHPLWQYRRQWPN